MKSCGDYEKINNISFFTNNSLAYIIVPQRNKGAVLTINIGFKFDERNSKVVQPKKGVRIHNY